MNTELTQKHIQDRLEEQYSILCHLIYISNHKEHIDTMTMLFDDNIYTSLTYGTTILIDNVVYLNIQ